MKHSSLNAALLAETREPHLETTSPEPRWLEQHMAPVSDTTERPKAQGLLRERNGRGKVRESMGLPVWRWGSISEATLVNALLASLRQVLVSW